jgi:hypothetical protein
MVSTWGVQGSIERGARTGYYWNIQLFINCGNDCRMGFSSESGKSKMLEFHTISTYRDPSRGCHCSSNRTVWGPLAGNILVGAELERKIYSISPSGIVQEYDTPECGIEDIDLIPPEENFFGVNYGQNRVKHN